MLNNMFDFFEMFYFQKINFKQMARASFLLPDFNQILNFEFAENTIIMSLGATFLTAYNSVHGLMTLDSVVNAKSFLFFIASLFAAQFVTRPFPHNSSISVNQPSFELVNQQSFDVLQVDVNERKLFFNSSLLFKNLTYLRLASLDERISNILNVFAANNISIVRLIEEQIETNQPGIEPTILQVCLTNVLLYFMVRQLFRRIGPVVRKKLVSLLPASPFKVFFRIGSPPKREFVFLPSNTPNVQREFDAMRTLQLSIFDKYIDNGNLDSQRLDAVLSNFEKELSQTGQSINGLLRDPNSIGRLSQLEIRSMFNTPFVSETELINLLVGFAADELLERFFLCKIWKHVRKNMSEVEVFQNFSQPIVDTVTTNIVNLTQSILTQKLNVNIDSDAIVGATEISIPHQVAVVPSSFLQSIKKYGSNILYSLYNSIPTLTGFLFPLLLSWTLHFISPDWLNSLMFAFGVSKTSIDLLAGNPTILWQTLTSYFLTPRIFQFTWLYDLTTSPRKFQQSLSNSFQNIKKGMRALRQGVDVSIQTMVQFITAAATIGVAFQNVRLNITAISPTRMLQLLYSKVEMGAGSIVSQLFEFCQKLGKLIVGSVRGALVFAAILFTLLTASLGFNPLELADTCVSIIGQQSYATLVSMGSVFSVFFEFTNSLIVGIARKENVSNLKQLLTSTPMPPSAQVPIAAFVQTLEQLSPASPSPIFALGKTIFDFVNATLPNVIASASASDLSYLIALILALVMMAISSRSIVSAQEQPTDDIDRSLCLYDWLDNLQKQISFQSDWCEFLVLEGTEKTTTQQKLRKNLVLLIENISKNPSCFVQSTNRTLSRLTDAQKAGFEVQTRRWQTDLVLDRQEIQQLISRERSNEIKNQLLDDFNIAYSSLDSILIQQLDLFSFLNQS